MGKEPDFNILHMLAAIPVPAFIFDMETRRFLAANPQFEKLLGYSDKELRTMTVSEIRPKEDVALLERALKQEPPEGAVEWRYVSKSGELLHVSIKYRNSEFLIGGRLHRTRLVVVMSWDKKPVRTAREVFED
jgi:PAS domain S-box-containing protein